MGLTEDEADWIFFEMNEHEVVDLLEAILEKEERK